MGPNPKLRRHRVLARTRSGGSGGDADLRPQTADRRPQAADGTATAEAPAQTAAGEAASHQAHRARPVGSGHPAPPRSPGVGGGHARAPKNPHAGGYGTSVRSSPDRAGPCSVMEKRAAARSGDRSSFSAKMELAIRAKRRRGNLHARYRVEGSPPSPPPPRRARSPCSDSNQGLRRGKVGAGAVLDGHSSAGGERKTVLVVMTDGVGTREAASPYDVQGCQSPQRGTIRPQVPVDKVGAENSCPRGSHGRLHSRHHRFLVPRVQVCPPTRGLWGTPSRRWWLGWGRR